jgi:hypothetical protein
MNRDDRLKAAEVALAKAEARLSVWAGPCRECRYCVRQLWDEPLYDLCSQPLVLTKYFDSMTGLSVSVSARDERGGSGLCGPNGELHEPIPVKLSWWERLFG